MKLKMNSFSTTLLISFLGALLYFIVLILIGQAPSQALKNSLIVCGSVLFASATLNFFIR
jgi:hypothetical protein